jgi:hypothetical protein
MTAPTCPAFESLSGIQRSNLGPQRPNLAPDVLAGVIALPLLDSPELDPFQPAADAPLAVVPLSPAAFRARQPGSARSPLLERSTTQADGRSLLISRLNVTRPSVHPWCRSHFARCRTRYARCRTFRHTCRARVPLPQNGREIKKRPHSAVTLEPEIVRTFESGRNLRTGTARSRSRAPATILTRNTRWASPRCGSRLASVRSRLSVLTARAEPSTSRTARARLRRRARPRTARAWLAEGRNQQPRAAADRVEAPSLADAGRAPSNSEASHAPDARRSVSRKPRTSSKLRPVENPISRSRALMACADMAEQAPSDI